MSPRRVGRPRRMSRRFDETQLGYHMKRAAPLEYSLILEASGIRAPKPELVEAIAYASMNPFFKTVKFNTCLRMYRKFKLRPPHPVEPSVLKELYYIRFRKAVVKNFDKIPKEFAKEFAKLK